MNIEHTDKTWDMRNEATLRRRSAFLGKLIDRRRDRMSPLECGLVMGCIRRLNGGQDLTMPQMMAIDKISTRLKAGYLPGDMSTLARHVQAALDARRIPADTHHEMVSAVKRLYAGVPMTPRQAGLWSAYCPEHLKKRA